MDYPYQHRWTFWNVAKLKTIQTSWYDSNDATQDLAFELDGSNFEEWLMEELEVNSNMIDTIVANGLYRLETRVPRYDDIETLEAAE
jgi:hypothetical protein